MKNNTVAAFKIFEPQVTCVYRYVRAVFYIYSSINMIYGNTILNAPFVVLNLNKEKVRECCDVIVPFMGRLFCRTYLTNLTLYSDRMIPSQY
jgi:hypothetical protein